MSAHTNPADQPPILPQDEDLLHQTKASPRNPLLRARSSLLTGADATAVLQEISRAVLGVTEPQLLAVQRYDPDETDDEASVLLPLPPPLCVCSRGAVAPPTNIDWQRFGIINPPTHDNPFLCHKCDSHYTHHAQACSQMRDIPWILPEMEADHVCLFCWAKMTGAEQKTYEKDFLKKHAAKFQIAKKVAGSEKYLKMFDKIMAKKPPRI